MSPTLYSLAISFLFALTALMALVPNLPERMRTSKLASTTAFFIVAALTMIVGRTPSMLYPEPINPDEAQMLAQALTLVHYPIPWKSYDPTTSGPLNSAILDLPKLIGIQPTYYTSRLIAVALILLAAFALYDVLRRAYGEGTGRLATLPILAFFSLVTYYDFTHYASELLSVALIAVAIDVGFSATTPKGELIPRRAFLCGLILGSLPFAKLQSVPFAILIFVTVFVLIWRKPIAGAARRQAATLLVCGSLLVPFFLVSLLVATGTFHDFAMSYIVLPYYYSRESCCHFEGASFFFNEPLFSLFAETCTAIVVLSIVAIAAARIWKGKQLEALSPAQAWLPVFFLVMTVTAVYAVEQPQKTFAHYLHLLLYPASGLAGSLAGIAILSWRRIEIGRSRFVAGLAAAAVVAAVAVLPTLSVRVRAGNDYLNGKHWNYNVQPPEVYQALRDRVRPGERMAIWGWMPQFYVATGATMGTRDSITQFQNEGTPLLSYYRERYISDMQANDPKFFLDAVSPSAFGYSDTKLNGFESFPQLQRIVDQSYHLVKEVDGYRLYERNS